MSSSTPDVSSTPQQPEIGSSTSRATNQDQARRETYSANKEADMIDLDDGEGGNVKKREKTSSVWSEFKDVSLSNGVEVGECVHCKKQLKKNKSKSTSQFKWHLDTCVRRKIFQNQQKKINFQSKDVEDEGFNMMQKRGMPEWEKVSRVTIKKDCMQRSSNQKIEYMVLTTHFIDWNWRLQKRIISFVHIPPPRRGVEIADCIYKCLQEWGIENKVFTIFVDNAASNDVAIRNLKDTFSRTRKLLCGGKLFHVRCCAHILNLMVQDGLSEIADCIDKVHESVRFINHNGNDHSAETSVLDDDGSSGGNVKSHKSGMSEILTYVKTLYSGPPQESDLDAYLLETCFIHPRDPNQFDALEWWKADSLRFRILSQMARYILAIPITTVASEATFSAGSRVIDTYWASLAPETIQALFCGGDWCRHLHGVKKKNQNEKKSIEVELK
ncbi:putative Zinc finger, BED-type [Corchorus olitorius]|uniref:Zinc finger, BED-type n=1 Tax=Corchorus olitorius TaxID=93759 RepID=A0A1R3J3V4_9ROSI|nr:putative Zinc finger, BED-type [Corchorus olitorius]